MLSSDKKTRNKLIKTRLFIDFDGTITDCDVGDGIFTRFMSPEAAESDLHNRLIADWKAGILSSEQCLKQECKGTIVNRAQFDEELERYELTPGFKRLVECCHEKDIPMMILSDGFDYYISYILEKHGAADIPFRSNHMLFNNGSLDVEFPWLEKGCGRCGNCKRWHIETESKTGERIIYAGDGYSDRFAIHDADVVFARRDLAEYCISQGREFIPYEDLHAITDYLETSDESS